MPCRTPYVAIQQISLGTTRANYAIVRHALHICCLQYLFLPAQHHIIQCKLSKRHNSTSILFFLLASIHSFFRSFFLSRYCCCCSLLFFTLSFFSSLSPLFLSALSLFAFCWLSVELCILWSCFFRTELMAASYCYKMIAVVTFRRSSWPFSSRISKTFQDTSQFQSDFLVQIKSAHKHHSKYGILCHRGATQPTLLQYDTLCHVKAFN